MKTKAKALAMIYFRSRNDTQQNVYINGRFEGIITLTKLGGYTLIGGLYRCPNTMPPLDDYWRREIRKEAAKQFAR